MSNLNQSFQGFHTQTWSQAIAQLERAGTDYVIATLLATTGSTPRASGTKMVITAEHIYDTLGGGHLEFSIIDKARELLATSANNHSSAVNQTPSSQRFNSQAIEHFQLAANLGQCCGGTATVLLEAMFCQHLKLDIYGAGHVAQALIPILSQLPIRIRWIDSRSEVFPPSLPDNVEKIVDEEPSEQVTKAHCHSAFLILTHNHQLDFQLTEAILKREDALWLGVIGSQTKAKRFRHRLAHRDFSQQQIDQMISPVGLAEVTGKLPMEVAVSIAGQLIALYQSQQTQPSKNQATSWQSLKNSLVTLPNNEPSDSIFGLTQKELNE